MSDSFDEYREWIVICGNSHVNYNNLYKFTFEEAEVVRKNMENKLLSKLDNMSEDDIKRSEIEWKLETLRTEKLVYN